MAFEPDKKNELNHHIRNGILGIKLAVKTIEAAIRRIEIANDRHDAHGYDPGGSSTEDKIRAVCKLLGVDPVWALAIAQVESSMGKHQKSPTGARGVFQMTTIAMKDLLQEMEKIDDDMIDICCGVLFLRLLKHRWGSEKAATFRYCDPKDRDFYVPSVFKLMNQSEDQK